MCLIIEVFKTEIGLKLNISGQPGPSSVLEKPNDEVPLSSFTDRLKVLYSVLASAPATEKEQDGFAHMLSAGLTMFGCEHALLMRPLSSSVVEVLGANTVVKVDNPLFYVGQHLNIDQTPISQLFSTQEVLAVHEEFGASSSRDKSFAYNDFCVKKCLGVAVKPSRLDTSLAVCFVSSNEAFHPYTAEDFQIIELLAKGVACMVDTQKVHAQRKMTDQAMFALGSVKTLDEYLEQARLPEVYGVPARVVEVLQRRVGHAALDISHIAEELNLSKRTLQRRLQQQEISFAELRDQVRFHYSLDYLIKQHLSIDSISASLDFSDRTSFTNAFKRWTGLSPSTFRKLFRDYV